jgi:hypothetical protein
MEKSNNVAKIYGYLVCLVAVITFIICIANLVNAFIDKGDPIHADRYSYGQSAPNLASYETYKMDILKDTKKESDTTKISFIPDEQTMKAMYEAAKNEKIQASMHNIKKEITVNLILIVVCIVLFGIHWTWMKRLAKNTQ